MENHDHNGHGDSHDDHATEGNRQSYPQGWWMPLAGLVVVALGFAIIGYFCFNVAGTDKWGKRADSEMHEGHGHGDAHGDDHDHEHTHDNGEKHSHAHGKDAHGHDDAQPNDAHMQADTTHNDSHNHGDSAKTLPAVDHGHEGHEHH